MIDYERFTHLKIYRKYGGIDTIKISDIAINIGYAIDEITKDSSVCEISAFRLDKNKFDGVYKTVFKRGKGYDDEEEQ